jgi:hypothetical protein
VTVEMWATLCFRFAVFSAFAEGSVVMPVEQGIGPRAG